MATYTTNLDLKKPAPSDKIRIADINNNMDTIDEAVGDIGETDIATQLGDIRGGMAIVSTGNTHDAIAAGQFVYVMGHDTLDDGLYTANSALAANATLSSSNLTAVSGGGLNALNSNLTSLSDQIGNINNDYVRFIKRAHASAGTYTQEIGKNRQFLVTFDRYAVQSSTYGGLYYIDTDTTGPHVYPISPSSVISSISVDGNGIITYTTNITYVRMNAIIIGR